jgi:carbonic anhydrase
MCGGTDFGNQAPLKLKASEAQPLSNTNYFFTQTNKNVTGTLNLEDYNNNLVFRTESTSPIGTVYYNLDFGEYDFFDCTKLYFRLPGEHILEGQRFDMELQFNCSGIIPGDRSKNYKYTFVALPVQKVKNFEESTKFFDYFENVKLADNITVPSFEEILDSFNMYKRIFYYKATASYPDCLVAMNWLFVENVLKIKEKTYDQIFSLLDPNQISDGNYRLASDKVEDYYILDNKFIK